MHGRTSSKILKMLLKQFSVEIMENLLVEEGNIKFDKKKTLGDIFEEIV